MVNLKKCVGKGGGGKKVVVNSNIVGKVSGREDREKEREIQKMHGHGFDEISKMM